jgi:hypothetical protein
VEAAEDLDLVYKALLWEAGRLEWKLHAAQQIIHESIAALPPTVKEAVILCSRRFGKSYYGCIRALMRARSAPKQIVRIVGPTIEQTQGIVDYNMAKITDDLRELDMAELVVPKRSDKCYRIAHPGGDSYIFLGGYDSQKDNLRGGEAHEILIEETGSSNPDQYAYQMRDVLKPQLLKTRGKIIHLTTLPPVPDHPFTLETIPQAVIDGAFHSYTIYEDPLATPEIIADAIKDSGGVDSDTFKREYLNQQIRDRSLVILPDYDEARNVEAVVAPQNCFLEVFTDFGGVRDLSVSLLMTYDYLRACDYVLAEIWWPNNTPTDVIKRETKEAWGHLPLKNWYADAAGQTLVDLNRGEAEKDLQRILACEGLPVVRLPKKDDFEAAVNNMANRVKHGKVKIHPDCKLLRMTCRSGVLNKNRTDFDRSKALGHMDATAALMYGVRCLDRTNPYPAETQTSDWVYVPGRNKPDQRQAIVNVPKSFGIKGAKRFGT